MVIFLKRTLSIFAICAFTALGTNQSFAKEQDIKEFSTKLNTSSNTSMENAMKVDFNNYAQIQSSTQIIDYQKLAAGINSWYHNSSPVPIDKQSTIRMNRDTLYSMAIIDLSEGASITLPDVGKRYISLAIQNEYGYTTNVYYGGGTYILDKKDVGSDYAMAFVRILIDAKNEEDVQIANSLQTQYRVSAKSNKPFQPIDFDKHSFEQTHNALLGLFKIAKGTYSMFGNVDEVDPIYFLVGTAGGFGGLPEQHAMYLNETPNTNAEHLTLTMKDVPVGAFWSVTVYNKDGYLFNSEYGSPSINSIVAEQNEDGSYTINFVKAIKGLPNSLAIEDGWNYVIRLYQPGEEILSGSWKRPALQVVK